MVLSTIDYIVIALYFAIIVGIGFVSMRFAKSKEEYLVAGRRLSFPLFFGCMAAMALGGGSTIGSTQLGYGFGLGGIWLNFSIGIGLILTGILVTSKLSKLRALSVNEVVEGSYGATARIFSSALTLIYELALSVTQVISIGTIISGILGLDSTLSMVVGGGVVILYTLMGGMWSVTMTDIVQFVIKTVGILVLAPLFCISAAGGWDQLVSKVPETYFSIGSMGFDKSFAYVVLYVPGLIIGQDMWQRIFTAKNDRVSKAGTIGAGVYSILYAFATVIIGMGVLALLPNLDDPQNAFVAGTEAFLPLGLRGLVLAAAVAATMSVSSSTILGASTIIYNDLYSRFVNKQTRPENAVRVTRICTALVGVLVMVCALWINDVLVGIDISYGYLSGCVFVPLMASFILKRFSPKAGLWSLATSSVAVTGCFVGLGTGSSIPIVVGMLCGLATYVVVSIVDKRRVVSQFADDADTTPR